MICSGTVIHCEVFWMLYLSRGLVVVINVQDFDLCGYNVSSFVRNKEKKCHAFDEEEKAIDFLNKHYEEDEVDPVYWRGGDNFLIRD